MPLVAAAWLVAAAPPAEPSPPALEAGWHSRWHSQSEYPRMAPGEVREFWIKFQNVGTETWERGVWGRQVNLAINYDDKTPFRLGMAVDWLWDDRLATTTARSVRPGEIGEFRFKIRAPASPGTYRLNLRPVVDGTTWLEDEGVFWIITVEAAFAASWRSWSGAQFLAPGEEALISLHFLNTGRETWQRDLPSKRVTLGMVNDDRRYGAWSVGWLSPERLALPNETSVAPGQFATFSFHVRVPQATPVGRYPFLLGLVIDGVTWLATRAEPFVVVDAEPRASSGSVRFTTFARDVADARPVGAAERFPVGTPRVFAFFEFDGLAPTDYITQSWTAGVTRYCGHTSTLAEIFGTESTPPRGVIWLDCDFGAAGAAGAPAGSFTLDLSVNGQRASLARFAVGAAPLGPTVEWIGALPDPLPSGTPGDAWNVCGPPGPPRPRDPRLPAPDTSSGCGGPSPPFNVIGTGAEPVFPALAPLAPSNYRVQGVVSDADTGAPLAGVCVTLGPYCAYQTGPDGFFWYDFPRWQPSAPQIFHVALREVKCNPSTECAYYDVFNAPAIGAEWVRTSERPSNPIAVLTVSLKRHFRPAPVRPEPRPRPPTGQRRQTPCGPNLVTLDISVTFAAFVLVNGVPYPRLSIACVAPGPITVTRVRPDGSAQVIFSGNRGAGVYQIIKVT